MFLGCGVKKQAIKHNLYICQNERSFRPSRYVAFYKEGKISYLFEVTEAPSKDCNEQNTPVLNNVKQYQNRKNKALQNQVMYLKKVSCVGPIKNDTVDKNGRNVAFVLNQRYTTYEKIMKAKKTSELI